MQVAKFAHCGQEARAQAIDVVGVLLVTILISMYVYDWSYDGQWYHICTVRELVNGWNPLWDTSVSSSVDRDTAMWVEHYPRGIETIVATVVAFLGNLDAGKVLNMWLVIASMGYVYIFLHDFLPNRTRYMRLWITVLITLNPVVIVQLFTCYIDWTLYTLLVIFLVNLYLFFEKGERRALYVDLLLLFFISFLSRPTIFAPICFCLSGCRRSSRSVSPSTSRRISGISSSWREPASSSAPLSRF